MISQEAGQRDDKSGSLGNVTPAVVPQTSHPLSTGPEMRDRGAAATSQPVYRLLGGWHKFLQNNKVIC